MKPSSQPKSLAAQARLVSQVASGKPLSPEVQEDLNGIAARLATLATRAEAPIADLPLNATPEEIRLERVTRAVRKGKDVYLPSWADGHSALPNVLLRSPLWSVNAIGFGKQSLRDPDPTSVPEIKHATIARAAEHSSAEFTTVSEYREFTLGSGGVALGWYDRRVFAACINYYRAARPLSPVDEGEWIEESFYRLLSAMNVAYNADSHKSLHASLDRLSTLSLYVRHKGRDWPLPRLFEASVQTIPSNAQPRASSLIRFRVLEPLAQLYGPYSWTAVPQAAFTGKGLRSWLSSFYATHSTPYALELKLLYRLSGTHATFPKFKAALQEALEGLSAPETPDEIRVRSYLVDRQCLTVRLHKWKV